MEKLGFQPVKLRPQIEGEELKKIMMRAAMHIVTSYSNVVLDSDTPSKEHVEAFKFAIELANSTSMIVFGPNGRSPGLGIVFPAEDTPPRPKRTRKVNPTQEGPLKKRTKILKENINDKCCVEDELMDEGHLESS